MELREKLSEVSSDRRFLGIFLTGVLLSFAFSVNNKSFPVFLGFFLSGSVVSLLVAALWTGIEKNYLRVIAVLAILLASGSGLLFFLQGQSSCVAWSAHSAENPVTNTCHAYVYGGCGPTPEPWYYGQCSPESRNDMCGRLENSSREDADQLHQHLCTDTPELGFEVASYDDENETITLEVEESNVNSTNTRILQLADDRNYTIEVDGEIYRHGVLVNRVNDSIFGKSLEEGDRFTVIRDGVDHDEDGIKGADPVEGVGVFFTFWWKNNETGATAGFEYMEPREPELSWIL